MNVRTDLLEQAFASLLHALKPTRDAIEVFREVVLFEWAEEKQGLEKRRAELQTQTQEARARAERVDKLFVLEGAIDRQTYEPLRNQAREDLILAEAALMKSKLTNSTLKRWSTSPSTLFATQRRCGRHAQ